MADEVAHPGSARAPSPTYSTHDRPPFEGTPPSDHFRVVKKLVDNSNSAVFICLSRELPPPAPESNALLQSITKKRVGNLKQKNRKRLPQLVIVKMGDKTRIEYDTIKKILDVKNAGLHIGSFIEDSTFASNSTTSWLTLRPVFGPTLQQLRREPHCFFPAWFLAHIAIGLAAGIHFLHRQRLVHNRYLADSAMLNPHLASGQLSWLDYPDVQLINLSQTKPIDQDAITKDVKELVLTIEWLVQASNHTTESQGPDQGKEKYQKDLQAFQQKERCTTRDLQNMFCRRAVALRKYGPSKFPHDMLRRSHSDLINDCELKGALAEGTSEDTEMSDASEEDVYVSSDDEDSLFVKE